jgi:hypothetical protein
MRLLSDALRLIFSRVKTVRRMRIVEDAMVIDIREHFFGYLAEVTTR